MKSFNGVHKVSKEEIIKQGSNDSGAENSESELSEVLVSSNKRRRSNDVIENDDKEPEESEEFSEYELLQKKNIEERNQFLRLKINFRILELFIRIRYNFFLEIIKATCFRLQLQHII